MQSILPLQLKHDCSIIVGWLLPAQLLILAVFAHHLSFSIADRPSALLAIYDRPPFAMHLAACLTVPTTMTTHWCQNLSNCSNTICRTANSASRSRQQKHRQSSRSAPMPTARQKQADHRPAAHPAVPSSHRVQAAAAIPSGNPNNRRTSSSPARKTTPTAVGRVQAFM